MTDDAANFYVAYKELIIKDNIFKQIMRSPEVESNFLSIGWFGKGERRLQLLWRQIKELVLHIQLADVLVR
jgi:hypothetical protein